MCASIVDRVNLVYQLPAHLEVKVANTYQELIAALHLVHQSYLERGYLTPSLSQLRLNLFHALPSTVTIVGKVDGKVIATVSIIMDSFAGIPSEKVFSFASFRSDFPIIAECSALAVDANYRGANGLFLFPLMKFIYHYAVNFLGVDLLVANVNPKQVRFYQEVLLFHHTGGEVTSYTFAHGAPGSILTFNCQNAYQRYHDQYAGLPPEKNLFQYFYQANFSQIRMPNPDSYFHRPRYLTPQMLGDLFGNKERIIQQLPLQDLLLLRLQYPESDYDQCFWHTILHRLDFSSRERRQPCFLTGSINGQMGKIINVSSHGLKFVRQEKVTDDKNFAHSTGPWQLEVQILQSEVQESVQIIWSANNLLGLSIPSPTSTWQQFCQQFSNHYYFDETPDNSVAISSLSTAS